MNKYFSETPADILGNENLREPQKQAYYKVYEHFILNQESSHALIVIPTGVVNGHDKMDINGHEN